MSKRIAIVQSSYIPWKGYFDLIASVDEFVLYDDAQYTKRDWRNRNRIKTADGLRWLTVPVAVTGRFHQRVRDTQISEPHWAEKHWRSVQASYGRAPFFPQYRHTLEELFLGNADDRLSAINYRFIVGLCGILGIHTRLTWSMDYTLESERTARLVGICRQAAATEYLSGPRARSYLDEQLFVDAGISVVYASYDDYAEYQQLYPPFEHAVSVIDLIVHTGPDARRLLLMNASRLAGAA